METGRGIGPQDWRITLPVVFLIYFFVTVIYYGVFEAKNPRYFDLSEGTVKIEHRTSRRTSEYQF